MKILGTELAYLARDYRTKRNLRVLAQYLAISLVLVLVFTILFHVIMLYEGKEHTWLTGLYWTLTVMSTLGFGDITFGTDLGRLFSILVLISGMVLLLVVLPFSFIHFFYAPWLEAQTQSQLPRAVPPDTSGHVIITHYDELAKGLVKRLAAEGVPCFVLEPDLARAPDLQQDGVPVIVGDPESGATYEALRIQHARLVFANCADTVNANILLTIRELSEKLPVLTLAAEIDSGDVLELGGASYVMPLKHRLGEQLANRVLAGHAQAQVIGRHEQLVLAELPVKHTFLEGKTVATARLRERFGLSIACLWERSSLKPVRPDTRLSDETVVVLVGSEASLARLNQVLDRYDVNPNPVLVIGAGMVGRAAALSLHQRGIPFNFLDRDETLPPGLRQLAQHVVIGDAAEREALMEAGLAKAPTVILSTSDDGTNIFLALYCRRLRPNVRILSRITEEKNLDAIHRAGADLVLSLSSLGVGTVASFLRGTGPVILGGGGELYYLATPASLHGKVLAESGIGARTGLQIIGLRQHGALLTELRPDLPLVRDAELLAIGTPEQRESFAKQYH